MLFNVSLLQNCAPGADGSEPNRQIVPKASFLAGEDAVYIIHFVLEHKCASNTQGVSMSYLCIYIDCFFYGFCVHSHVSYVP